MKRRARVIGIIVGLAFSGFGLSAQTADDSPDNSYGIANTNYGIESQNSFHTFTVSGSAYWPPETPAGQKSAAQQGIIAQINQTTDWDNTTKNNAIYVVNHVVWNDTETTVVHGGQTFKYTASQEICVDCQPGKRIILTFLQLKGPF
jgi:hypothetical protein